MVKVRVLIADKESLFCEGVCALLKTREDIEVVGEASNGRETVERVRQQVPDIVLMNITMPVIDGAEVIHQIHKENSNIKVLLVSQYEDEERVLSGLKAGASGYIPKRATASDLVSAILAIYRGGYFLYLSLCQDVCSFLRKRIQGTVSS